MTSRNDPLLLRTRTPWILTALVGGLLISQGCGEANQAPNKTASSPAIQPGIETDDTSASQSETPDPKQAQDHGHGDDGFLWHRHTTPPSSGGPVILLNNTNDPVTRKPLPPLGPDDKPITLDFRGFQIRFADALTRWRFEGAPLRYLHQLNLEPHPDGSISQIDPSGYLAAVPETCPMMGSAVDPFGSVYVLHRGWKIYFCCWTGCGDQFMQDPVKWYPDYQLKEQPGEALLVLAQEPI